MPRSRLARFDEDLRAKHGVSRIGGLDEAGRGPLAGPVVAAVVVIAPGVDLPGVNDSKALSPEDRDSLVPLILKRACAAAIGLASTEEIDEVNILEATHIAARRALARLPIPPEFLVTDFLKLKNPPCPILPIPKADSTSQAVAAASVLAKVARDRLMAELDREHPGYGFARHKGYGTPEHLAALRDHGPSPVHRFSFSGVCWFDSAPPPRPVSAAGPSGDRDLISLLI